MKIAAAYLRVSTEEQDEYSLDSQLKLIREYAKNNDFLVPDEFVFTDDGVSGRNARKRESFQRMIALAKQKEPPFDSILLWKFSRFARNQEEAIVYKSLLKKAGIGVISISEPLPDGPFASLIERIIEWMDEYYSIRLAGEVKRGMIEKVSRGEPVCHPAFGYDLKEKRYYPNSDADWVRWVFSSFSSGMGMRQIAAHLADHGVRTGRGGLPDNRFVEYMLNNPLYIGKIRWSPEGRKASRRKYDDPSNMIVDGLHDAIIDMETWEKTQGRLKQLKAAYRKHQRPGQPVQFMLKGLVHCSSCGATLVYQSLACPSLQCHNYNRGKCKTSHSLSVSKGNAAVISALEYSVDNLDFALDPDENTTKRASERDYKKLISAEQTKLGRVQQAYEAGIDTLEEYAEKKRRILEEIESLRQQANEEKNVQKFDPIEYAKKVSAVLELIKNPTVAENAKNEALRSILSRIVYEKKKQNLALYFYI